MEAKWDKIILEILARLPVKSLLMAKAVCKLWHMLVEVSGSMNLSLTCVDSILAVSELSLGLTEDSVEVRASLPQRTAVLLQRRRPRRTMSAT